MRQWTGESVADGRYVIGDAVGRGREARVHAARDRILRRSVAVKFLPHDGATTPRWLAEAAALDRFDHRHIVRLLDGGTTADAAYLVLPLFPGSLVGRLDDGPLPLAETADLVLALADGLGHVHRAGLTHGGVDPACVLVDELGLPCWSGLPGSDAGGAGAQDLDLQALAALAVRCVTGDDERRTAPHAVVELVRTAAGAPAVPDLRRRLVCALESVAPTRRARPDTGVVGRRGRPAFAAALGLGFAASVFAGLVVDSGAVRTTIGAAIPDSNGAAMLSERTPPPDVLSAAQDAMGRIGSLFAPLPESSTAESARAAADARSSVPSGADTIGRSGDDGAGTAGGTGGDGAGTAGGTGGDGAGTAERTGGDGAGTAGRTGAATAGAPGGDGAETAGRKGVTAGTPGGAAAGEDGPGS